MDYTAIVRRALDFLVEGLSRVVQQTLLEAFGPGSVRPLGTDPQVLLSAIINNWDHAFAAVLPAQARTLAFDLRASRNEVAHHQTVGFDDAFRAVDSVERLFECFDEAVPEGVTALKSELLASLAGTSAQEASTSAPAEPIARDAVRVPAGSLGMLWMHGRDSGDVAFDGVIRCPQCAAEVRVLGRRYVHPTNDKAPPFILLDASGAQRQVGHLFLAKIKTSPKLFYGALSHCGQERWISLFFNRSFLGGDSPHLIVMESKPSKRTPEDDVPW